MLPEILTSPACTAVNASDPAKADRPTFVMFFMFISIFVYLNKLEGK